MLVTINGVDVATKNPILGPDQGDFLKRSTPPEVDARPREIVRAGKPARPARMSSP